ncbi:MAG: CHASE2 domain-containing protein, partial [Bacteroidota bacterium]
MIALVALLLVALLHVPLSSVEDQITALKYRVRGARQADTNIVIVYIDNDAITDLGRPVRRNFYALMVKALTELHVKAIGIEPVFEQPVKEHPEYDDLFAAVLGSSNNVVLSSYFNAIHSVDGEPARSQSAPQHLLFPSVTNVSKRGLELHLPLPALLANTAGVGHLNLDGDVDIPMFVRSEGGVAPSFGMEVLRIFNGVQRSGVGFDGATISVGPQTRFESFEGGMAALDFPGPISSFRVYPFVEVLKSYDAVRLDRTPSLPVRSFKDKIVLISVVAEERSVYVNTPVAARYPSVGLHATFLDNALRSRFLSHAEKVPVYLLTFLLGCCCAVAILFLKSPLDKILAFGLPVVVVVMSFFLFASSAYLLPVLPLFVVGSVSAVSALFYKQRLVGAEVGKLVAEKDVIISQLKEKEAKVLQLENELLQLEASKSADRTSELLEEIRKYKVEIHALASKADDMEEFKVDQMEVQSSVGEFEGIVYDRSGKMKPVI